MDVERNFRFGLTALRDGLITPEQLAEAGTEWMASRERPLADVLATRGWLSDRDRSTVEDRVARDLEPPTTAAGGGDPSCGSTRDFRGDDRETDADLALAPPDAAEGDGFGGRYRTITLHASGGIGRVWRVYDTVLRREVALKELRRDRDVDLPDVRRFFEEARITAGLEHPNIVPAHDLSRGGARAYYTMRFLGQQTLKDQILKHHRGRGKGDPDAPTLRGLLESFLGVCNAIAFAHSRGVIHRDLKGQNVVIGAFGQAIVLDWGLARRLDDAEDPLARPAPGLVVDEGSLTTDGYPIGTPNYMPPEQARGDRAAIGIRSDVFGLGTILYMILTGRAPFEGGDTTSVVALAREAAYPRPSSLDSSVPPALEAICLKAMAPDPGARYETASDLSADVRRWLDDEAVAVHEDAPLTRLARWGRKHQPAVAGAVAILATAVVSLGVGAWRLGQETQRVVAANDRAQRARDVAVRDLEAGIRVINASLGAMQEELPAIRDPAAERFRLRIADAGATLAQDLAGRHGEEAGVAMALGDLLIQAARVHRLAGRTAQAEALTRRALAVLEGIAARHTLPPPATDALASYGLELAQMLLDTEREEEAVPVLDRAEAAARALRGTVGNHPGVNRTEAQLLMARGLAARRRGEPGAPSAYDAALAKLATSAASPAGGPADSLLILMACLGRGAALREEGRAPDAVAGLIEARDRALALPEGTPLDVDRRAMVAAAEIELARALALRDAPGDADEADRLLQGAIDALAGLAVEHPDILAHPRAEADARLERGLLLARRKREAEAEGQWRECERLLADLERRAPGAGRDGLAPVRIAAARAALAMDRGDTDAAKRLLGEADAEIARRADPSGRRPESRAARDQVRAARDRLARGSP